MRRVEPTSPREIDSGIRKTGAWTRYWAAALLGLFLTALPSVWGSAPQVEPGLRSAALLTLTEARIQTQFDYVMTGKIRFLVFWKGFDDVGGGYIRRSVSSSDPGIRLIEVLLGSDPEKAPRRINKWGAATEAVGNASNAFFGFMSRTDSDSVDEAEVDLATQAERGTYPFNAIFGYVDGETAISRSIPLFAVNDYDIHEFDEARDLIRRRLAEAGPVRTLDPPARRCPDARGFLQSVEQLIDHALALGETPRSLCYVYNARDYTLILDEAEPVDSKTVEVERSDGSTLQVAYENLVRARFQVLNHESKRSSFELLLGRDDDLRGVPVQIVHQPNFWFKVELNLEPSPGETVLNLRGN